MRYASIGSISSGTMRAEDLIPEFAWNLDYYLKRQPRSFPRKEHRALIREANKITDFDSEESGYVLEELFDALNEYAPPYFYFGAHEGDGSDYGFWLNPHSFNEKDWEGLKVEDTSEVPKGYRGEVLHVNDHGNMTLYYCNARGKLKEIWGIV